MGSLQLISGDLWDHHERGEIIAVTTCGLIKKDGSCAMPRGCARQAAQRFPQLPYSLGEQLRRCGMHVFDLGNRILSFPVERTPYENPEADIIRQSCAELVKLTDDKQWERVIVPRPGCGGGGMLWDEVEKILEDYFDTRFLIIGQ
jgi:hypothetical protein